MRSQYKEALQRARRLLKPRIERRVRDTLESELRTVKAERDELRAVLLKAVKDLDDLPFGEGPVMNARDIAQDIQRVLRRHRHE